MKKIEMDFTFARRTLATLLSFQLLFISTPANAQFNKYRSKTKFDKKPMKNAEQFEEVNESTPRIDLSNSASGGKDIFGRGTGVKGVINAKQNSKYVNLNPETAFGPEVITSFDFPKITLLDLTKHMQKLTGINLILDKDLKGDVSIYAPSPITVGDAWKAYLEALNMNGYNLTKTGAFYKIINNRDVRYTPTKIYSGTYTPDTENYVMRIIPLKNITANEITRSFRPFMSRYGRILDIKQTNTIIIHDTGSNINRLVKLIKFLDVPGHEESLQIFKVKYSSAQEIASLLTKILKNEGTSKKLRGSKSSSNVEIIAEPRTNSIIAMANDHEAEKLRQLIRKLDVKGASSGSGKVPVYYLHHSDAESISKTLSALVSDSSGSKRAGSRFTKNSSSSNSAGLFVDEVKVTADKENNALVISASPTDYLTLKSVLRKLDIPRDQVYVEGLIMETSINKINAFGVSLLGAYGSGTFQKAAFNSGNMASLADPAGILNISNLFVGGGVGPSKIVEIGGAEYKVNSVNGLIEAIASNSNTNVLATPQILALDNTEASFSVGSKVPISEVSTATTGATTANFKLQDVTLDLKIKPQINKVTRYIKLDIDQKIEDFADSSATGPGGGRATTVRSAVTKVVVRDRDTIAMGGLMRDKVTKSVKKVPILGDIPVLGWLFKRQEKAKEKINMLFFLTPRILTSTQKAAKTLRNVINRRSSHLKEMMGSEDPFNTTLKGLYNKAKKQEEGPLYDPSDNEKFLRENDSVQGTGLNEAESAQKVEAVEIPNYKRIAKDATKDESSSNKEDQEFGELFDDELDTSKKLEPVVKNQES